MARNFIYARPLYAGRRLPRLLGVKLTTAIDPLEVQFHLVHDCIRACVYADHIGRAGVKKDAWLSIGDMCYSYAILSWNHIFGTNSQQSHWKKLLANVPLPARSPLEPFGKAMIVEYLKTTDDEWDRYHAKMVEFRNDRIAHFDHSVVRDKSPNVTWALHSSYLYREWLLSLLRAHQASGRPIKITETTGEAMLALFRAQIEEVCR